MVLQAFWTMKRLTTQVKATRIRLFILGSVEKNSANDHAEPTTQDERGDFAGDFYAFSVELLSGEVFASETMLV